MYYESTVTVYLRKDLPFYQCQEQLGGLISSAMLLDSELATLHSSKGYKFYVFNGLWPIVVNSDYQANRTYIFNIRSLNKDFLRKLTSCLKRVDNPYLHVLASEQKTLSPRFVQEIYTLTPIVVTTKEQKPWLTQKESLLDLIDSLNNNAMKKHLDFYGEKIAAPFIQRIEILNKKPCKMTYKGRTMLGNKVRIIANEDQESQKLVQTVLGAGLGEKNSVLGAGFCHGN